MRVTGRSMTPALRPGSLVMVNPRAFGRRLPRRHELVAARPRALDGRAVVKRLVGLPGESVQLEQRRWQLAADEFFLLGDRPEDSVDSRRFGPVSADELLGPVRPLLPFPRGRDNPRC
jgi:type IV secretory pathway protease TraF